MTFDTPYPIGPAAPSDLASILLLLSECQLPPDGLSDHVAACLIARGDGGVCGCVALELYESAALLRSLAVDAALRGRGMGKTLADAALALASQHGVRDVYLLTETAPNFFRRLGFEDITRAAVPASVQASVEFTSACPQTARAMHLSL